MIVPQCYELFALISDSIEANGTPRDELVAKARAGTRRVVAWDIPEKGIPVPVCEGVGACPGAVVGGTVADVSEQVVDSKRGREPRLPQSSRPDEASDPRR